MNIQFYNPLFNEAIQTSVEIDITYARLGKTTRAFLKRKIILIGECLYFGIIQSAYHLGMAIIHQAGLDRAQSTNVNYFILKRDLQYASGAFRVFLNSESEKGLWDVWESHYHLRYYLDRNFSPFRINLFETPETVETDNEPNREVSFRREAPEVLVPSTEPKFRARASNGLMRWSFIEDAMNFRNINALDLEFHEMGVTTLDDKLLFIAYMLQDWMQRSGDMRTYIVTRWVVSGLEHDPLFSSLEIGLQGALLEAFKRIAVEMFPNFSHDELPIQKPLNSLAMSQTPTLHQFLQSHSGQQYAPQIVVVLKEMFNTNIQKI